MSRRPSLPTLRIAVETFFHDDSDPMEPAARVELQNQGRDARLSWQEIATERCFRGDSDWSVRRLPEVPQMVRLQRVVKLHPISKFHAHVRVRRKTC